MTIDDVKFLKRLVNGSNPRSRSRTDEYKREESRFISYMDEEERREWDEACTDCPSGDVRLPKYKGKRYSKAKVVWFDEQGNPITGKKP